MTKKIKIFGAILVVSIIVILCGQLVRADMTPNLIIDSSNPYSLKVATPNPHDWSDGLVGYWTFNGQDIVNSTTTDKSVDGNDGTIVGAVPQAGIIGQDLSFDGIDDYVSLPDLGLDEDTSFTMETWVKIDRMTMRGGIMMKGTGANSYGLQRTYNTVNFAIRGPSGHFWTTSDVLIIGEWYHFIGTYAANEEIKIYQDGRLIDTTAVGALGGVTSGDIIIGNHAYSSVISPKDYLLGSVDEVRIYDKILSLEDVQEHYSLSRRNFIVE